MLSFEKGQFVIQQLPQDLEREKKDHWRKASSGQWHTSSLRAAMQFIQDADESAKVILERFQVRYYPLPLHDEPPDYRKLDPHQVSGVHWILTRSRAYLAQAPGAGKTIQAIVAAKIVGGDALVICPPLLVENWKREIQKWDPGTSVLSIDDRFESRDYTKRSWVIFPDSLLIFPSHRERLVSQWFTFVAVDEASRYKDIQSVRSMSLFGGSLIQRAKHTVLLDGSPMPNRQMELWAPTFYLAPEVIGYMDEQEFGFRYCAPRLNSFGQWEFRGASKTEELRKRLTRKFMHIVEEKELVHPERRRKILYLSRDVRSPKMIRWEKRGYCASNDDNNTSHEAELGLRKVPWALEYIKERATQGEKLLVFFWHREVGRTLAVKLRPHLAKNTLYVDGATSMEDRAEFFQEYQANEAQVIVGNVLAMGRGVNLQETDRIIFIEYSWSDEVNKQAEKRASRRGSTRKFVPCDYLCCPGSFDEVKLNVLFRKQKLVERLITNEEG